MLRIILINNKAPAEKVFLLYVSRKFIDQSSYAEFIELALSAGAKIEAQLQINLNLIAAKTFIGQGKLDEIKFLVDVQQIDLLIINVELSPSQQRNLQKALSCRVITRSELILDIFAKRALSYEGKLQVEMTQLIHRSSRLIRGAFSSDRQKGGIGLKGPGETQLETDRRLIKLRIKSLSDKLGALKSQRAERRKNRQHISIALVGYTNAGKSSLFNALTKAEALVANQLFATLDPNISFFQLPAFGQVVLSDTVGFISELPTAFVKAFRATLEEASESQLILHVIDGANPSWPTEYRAVMECLKQMDALDIPRINVFNKSDLGQSAMLNSGDESLVTDGVRVSALKHLGFDSLLKAMANCLSKTFYHLGLNLPHREAKLRAEIFAKAIIGSEKLNESQDGVLLVINVEPIVWQKLCHQFAQLNEYLIPIASSHV